VLPPFVGVAVKVTLFPAQMVFPGVAAIDTEGVTVPVTDMVIVLDIAVVGLTQFALEVNTTET